MWADRALLAVNGLNIEILSRNRGRSRWKPLVRDISFHVERGESVCLVGESGCGKSITSLAVMGLLASSLFRIASGEMVFQGSSITSDEAVRKVRGSRMGMVFQEPMTALNPVFTAGFQIAEAIRIHMPELSDDEVNRRVLSLLSQVGMPDPERAASAYPHQLSGGLRQRVMIAMALSCDPDLLIADEPTTALDVTIQAQILELIAKLQQARGLGLLMITHNLGVVAQIADRVLIMYAGRIVEEAPVKDLFQEPMHPYTRGLLASVPYSSSGYAEEAGNKTAGGAARNRLHSIPGSVPPLDALPQGCAFKDRCDRAMEICGEKVPELKDTGSAGRTACHLYA